MGDSLRDQLLGLGFKPPPKPDKPRSDRPKGDRPRPDRQAPDRRGAGARPVQGAGPRNPGEPQPPQRRDGSGKGPAHRPAARSQGDIDLAKAYAIRAQREKDERIAEDKRRQDEARQRREARAALDAFLEGKALNDPAAEIARHFEYGGRIKRAYVTADQLRGLNAGELGLVQQQGRYLLVSAAVLAEVEAIFAPAIALKVDPSAPAPDDPYADPKYQVPDDLVW